MTCAQVWGPARGWGAHGGGVMRLRVGLLGFDPVDFPKGHFTNHMGPSAPQRTPVAMGATPWAVSTPRAKPRRWQAAVGPLSRPSRQGLPCLIG